MSNQIREVKDASDIAQVIGERIQLQRAGRNLRALCPFHSEKSPSFFVTPDLQVFRCFGCGERGDVFTFLQKYEGLTFGESLKMLADKAGIKLEAQHFTPEDTQRERLLEILDLSKSYFHFLLTDHKVGEIGKKYLKDRGINNEIIKEFQIGFAPESWDGLIRYVHGKKKYSLADMSDAGLIILRNGAPNNSTTARDYYDRFRSRIIFPLTDHRGRVVGFSGRVLNPEEKTAKYINSPETSLYHKSELLFGFSQHYRALREAQSAIIAEGEFDVLSSAQAHVRNIVAIKGSALTKEHLERLQRVVNTIVLSLDADKAGVAATKRAIDVARGFDLRIKVLSTVDLAGKDPDEIARENPKAWREHVKKAISAYQFLIDAAVTQNDITTGEGKQAVVAELVGVLLRIPHLIEQSHYIEELAKKLNVSGDMLRKDLQNYHVKKETNTTVESKEQQSWTPREKLEISVMGELLKVEPTDIQIYVHQIESDWISHPGFRQLFDQLKKNSRLFNMKKFSAQLAPELHSLFAEVYLDSVEKQESDAHGLQGNIQKLKQLFFKEKEQELLKKIETLDTETKSSDQENEEQKLLLELQTIREKMKT